LNFVSLHIGVVRIGRPIRSERDSPLANDLPNIRGIGRNYLEARAAERKSDPNDDVLCDTSALGLGDYSIRVLTVGRRARFCPVRIEFPHFLTIK
jgi:hypothetical protein